MGLIDTATDANKVHEFEYSGTKIQVRQSKFYDMLSYINDNAPTGSDESAKDQRRIAMAEYFAHQVVVGWDDPDIPFSPESAFQLLQDESFQALFEAVQSESQRDDNFRMERDEAVKKLSSIISAPTSSGEQSG